jgi:Flp pilus assembly protein TadD
MKSHRTWPSALVIPALLIFLLGSGKGNAAPLQEEICDTSADYALGIEDYAAAITLHRRVLRSQPDNALAHYHLGFVYGMMGRSSDEMREYLKAVDLGLRKWDLYLDLGLAYLEHDDYPKALSALETAVLLGPQHSETHLNLAIADEKADRLDEAMKQITVVLQMAASDVDARNTKAIICADLGDLSCARDEWTLLTRIAPDYVPARTNLAILNGSAPEPVPSIPNAVEISQVVQSVSWSSQQ